MDIIADTIGTSDQGCTTCQGVLLEPPTTNPPTTDPLTN